MEEEEENGGAWVGSVLLVKVYGPGLCCWARE